MFNVDFLQLIINTEDHEERLYRFNKWMGDHFDILTSEYEIDRRVINEISDKDQRDLVKSQIAGSLANQLSDKLKIHVDYNHPHSVIHKVSFGIIGDFNK